MQQFDLKLTFNPLDLDQRCYTTGGASPRDKQHLVWKLTLCADVEWDNNSWDSHRGACLWVGAVVDVEVAFFRGP